MKRVAVWLLLAWVAFAGVFLAYKMSPTADEGIHVESAYLALTRHDFRFDPEHPPLFKYLSALPILALKPHLPTDDARLWQASEPSRYDSWREAREWMVQWFYTSSNRPQEMIFLARIPAILCLIALNFSIFFLIKKWFGERLALWTLFFTAFNPTLLAHGSLANTDVPLALACVLLLGGLYTYWKKPTIWNAALCGLLIAICMLTKFSGVVAVPVAGSWFIYVHWMKKTSWKTVTLHALKVIGVIYLMIWVTYLFHTREHVHFLPFDFLKGLALVAGGSVTGRGTFILGTMHPTGVWYYFPLMFALKSQLIVVILLASGACHVTWKKWRTWDAATWLLVLFAVVFGALSIKSKLNLGIRHISPLLPLASVALAAVTLRFLSWKPQLKWAIVALYVVPVLIQWNNPLGFTNILVGNPTYSYKLIESNGDWGQQTKDIAKAGYKNIRANYLWDNRALAAYGVNAQGFDVNHPPKGEVIMVHAIQLSNDSGYAMYNQLTPIAHIANHTFFYRLPESGIVPE